MLREMRPYELAEWIAFFGINPWGEERADLRAGIVASTLANVNRDPKRRPEPYRATDFMPYRRVDSAAQSADLSKRILAALAPLKKRAPKDGQSR